MREAGRFRSARGWPTAAVVAVAASFVFLVDAPGSHTAARTLPLWNDKASVQVLAPNLEVELSADIPPAPTDTWTIKLAWGPADSEEFGLPRTEHEIAKISGAGSSVPRIPIGAEWRWYLMPLPLVGLRVYTTVTSGGRTQTTMQEVDLVAREGARQYNPTVPGKFGGAWRGYPHGAALMVPPVPYYSALSKLVRSRMSAGAFAVGNGLRTRVSAPFSVPPRDAKRVSAEIYYVPPSGGDTVVYRGSARIPAALAPGARVRVPTRLTLDGVRVAQRLGVRKLARALKSSGYVFFTSAGGAAHGGDTAPEMIEVPLTSCFRIVNGAPRHPCVQTCPHFPDVQGGYMVYTAIGDVYGSYTCSRGAPLVPWPMY